MGFKKMQKAKYPPRLWSLVGYPGSGKSTFASQLKGPMVVVDADHRFQEVIELASEDVYELSDTKADNVDPDRINALLMNNMPGSDVQTIVVDSLTAIITPLVVQAMVDSDKGRNRNKAAAFRTKALAMRQLQDAVSRWGTDVLWIYHLQDARDNNAKEITRATISSTESARLMRSINLELQIVSDPNNPDRRGMKVNWARRGRSGMTIWDETGRWDGMPEKIEAAIYDGLTSQEREDIERENENPTFFRRPEDAWNWAVEKGAFSSVEKAHRAYDNVKRDEKPRNAQQMAEVWVQHVGEVLAIGLPEDEDDVPFDEPAPPVEDEPPF